MRFGYRWKGFLVGLVIVYLFVWGNRGLYRLYQLHEDKTSLTEQIFQLQAQVLNYQNEYKRFNQDPTAIEKRAREELNLVKPGEMVYRFETPAR
jgi:cell division protein FtsB